MPFILLKGYWLEQSGFSIGAKVEVSLEKGVLLIKQTARVFSRKQAAVGTVGVRHVPLKGGALLRISGNLSYASATGQAKRGPALSNAI